MTNKRNGTLYVGVTSNLIARAYQHKQGTFEGFTKKYGLKMLVYYEVVDNVLVAIKREKNIKAWPRNWKLQLIEEKNPQWKDLYEEIV